MQFSTSELVHLNYIKDSILEQFPDIELRMEKRTMQGITYNCILMKEKEIFLSITFTLLFKDIVEKYLYPRKLYNYLILVES